MSQFGSMEPLLQLSTMEKKEKKLPSSWLLGLAQVLSLYAAVLFGCIYGGSAYYILEHGPPSCLCPCGGVQVPVWFVRRFVLTGADAVDAAVALLDRLLCCSGAAVGAAVLPLALRSRRDLGVRDPGFVIALVATAASHWMYLRVLGLFRVNSPGDLYLAVETACVFAAAALNLLGFMAFVLGDGGDDGEQAGRALAARSG